ncbi:MAG: hypothetical protein MHMPM18_001058 [Marteilia pararefringens]
MIIETIGNIIKSDNLVVNEAVQQINEGVFDEPADMPIYRPIVGNSSIGTESADYTEMF